MGEWLTWQRSRRSDSGLLLNRVLPAGRHIPTRGRYVTFSLSACCRLYRSRARSLAAAVVMLLGWLTADYPPSTYHRLGSPRLMHRRDRIWG
jgi:hypothetical protein